ncbi:non-heme iron oxygenase ferredoxin subunit [Planktomarina temperata]|nr:non-heme iron oxygenase ferredoxin subunit [Yoonia sp.]MDA8525128.1 non-heme iron oxygenase ferredoxin subunit [Planktomarina temperata]MDA9235607.1 non-heme iron oxygenase ferredoxin subunit [bacterium]MDA8875609.1 non-heme iron oxygenase ferredoxin subunit [Planktomarina temperata]MDB4006358.1 non-heme iron oxygenase ferredoxin subunit [Planktomarina temperata]
MAEASNQIEICAKDDVSDGEVIRVDKGDLELAVYHVDGAFYVTDNMCTHGPGELSEGYLEGHVIECDFHQGKFDIRDGAVVAPPCITKIKTYKVVPHDTAVMIEAP